MPGKETYTMLLNEYTWSEDSHVEATFENILSMEASYGVICRYSDDGWYELRIYVSGPRAGSYTLFRYEAALKAQYKTPYIPIHAGIDNLFTHDIKLGLNVKNKIGLNCEGNKFKIFINDKAQTQYRNGKIEDTTFSEGIAGVIAQTYGNNYAKIDLTEFRITGDDMQMVQSPISQNSDSVAVLPPETQPAAKDPEPIPTSIVLPEPTHIPEDIIPSGLSEPETVAVPPELVSDSSSLTEQSESLTTVTKSPVAMPDPISKPPFQIEAETTKPDDEPPISETGGGVRRSPITELLPQPTDTPVKTAIIPEIIPNSRLGQKINCGNAFQFTIYYQPTMGKSIGGKTATGKSSMRVLINNLTDRNIATLPVHSFKLSHEIDGARQTFLLLRSHMPGQRSMVPDDSCRPDSCWCNTGYLFGVRYQWRQGKWILSFWPILKQAEGPLRVDIELQRLTMRISFCTV